MSSIVYTFDTATNYVFNSSTVSLLNNGVSLKDIRPTGATFFAPGDTDVNAVWGGGGLTGTAVGSVTVSGGAIDTSGFDGKKVYWGATGNSNFTQQGTIRARFKVGYNGTPAENNFIYSNNKGDGTLNNMVELVHLAAGSVLVSIYAQTGTSIINGTLYAWSATADTWVEAELDIDIDNGVTQLFWDGVQQGITQTATGTRDNSCAKFEIGSNYLETTNNDNVYDYVVIFDQVKHTSNYTPNESISSSIYSLDNQTIEAVTAFTHDGLLGYSETSIIVGSDYVRGQISKDGVYYWYDSGWTIAAATCSNANTAAEINANVETFASQTTVSKMKWFLCSADGSTTPVLSVSSFLFRYSGETRDSYSTCMVWAYNLRPDGEIDTNTISAILNKDVVQYKNNVMLRERRISDTPNSSNGYWGLRLIETDNMTGSAKYIFNINGSDYVRQVPNTTSAVFWTLEE